MMKIPLALRNISTINVMACLRVKVLLKWLWEFVKFLSHSDFSNTRMKKALKIEGKVAAVHLNDMKSSILVISAQFLIANSSECTAALEFPCSLLIASVLNVSEDIKYIKISFSHQK